MAVAAVVAMSAVAAAAVAAAAPTLGYAVEAAFDDAKLEASISERDELALDNEDDDPSSGRVEGVIDSAARALEGSSEGAGAGAGADAAAEAATSGRAMSAMTSEDWRSEVTVGDVSGGIETSPAEVEDEACGVEDPST